MATLTDYLKGKRPAGFTPHPHYSPEGDSLTFYIRNEDAYARRVDDFLTVYLSTATDDLVGCQVKGVRRIFKRSSFGIAIEQRRVGLGQVFLAYMAFAEAPEARERYEELGRAASQVGATLPVDELVPA